MSQEITSIEFTLRMTKISSRERLLHTSLKGTNNPDPNELQRMFREFFNDPSNPDYLKDIIIQASMEGLLDNDPTNPMTKRMVERIREVMSNHFDLCQEFVNEVKDNNAK